MNSLEDLESYLRKLEQENEFSGVVLITRGKNSIFSDSLGYANIPWKIKNKADTRFDTASTTKLFTAAAILQLIDQNKLTLDTRIVEFLKLENTSISPEVNIYHLLTHTSGIADDCEEEDGEIYEELWKKIPNYSVTETAHFLPNFIYKAPNFKPGQKCRYCNCSFILLGLAIEKISGMTYREYVKKNIFEKLGMNATAFLRLDGTEEDKAEGYIPNRDDKGKIINWRRNIYAYPPIGTPDSGAYTTASDLDLFLKSIQQNRLLSEKLTEEFLAPHVFYRQDKDSIRKYGFVFEFKVNSSGNIVFYQKGGINAGVGAMMTYFPSTDINSVILANYDNCAWEPIKKINHMIEQGMIK